MIDVQYSSAGLLLQLLFPVYVLSIHFHYSMHKISEYDGFVSRRNGSI